MVASSLEYFVEVVVVVVVDVDIVVEKVVMVEIPMVPLVLGDWHFDPFMRNSGGCTIPDCKCLNKDHFFVEV